MPFCRRDCDDTAAFIKPDEKKIRDSAWREPPGRLGEYVRRVKRLSDAMIAPEMPPSA